MTAEHHKKYSDILDLIAVDNYSEALKEIREFERFTSLPPKFIYRKADCLYELADDLGAIEHYLLFLESHPGRSNAGYALYGIAMCLKNLGAHDLAILVLEKVSDEDHPNRLEEISHSRAILKNKLIGRKRFSEFSSTLKLFGISECQNQKDS